MEIFGRDFYKPFKLRCPWCGEGVRNRMFASDYRQCSLHANRVLQQLATTVHTQFTEYKNCTFDELGESATV
jgi:hypothetical protein